jgi:Uma2 family endonuclease
MKAAASQVKDWVEGPAPPLVLRTRPVLDVSEEQFFALCQLNRDLRLERTARGEWLIMAPAGGATGGREAEIIAQLVVWAKRDGTGQVFSSSTGFRLPNTAVRSPDAAWVPHARLAQVSDAEQEQFLPLCPDFVLELRSPSDRLRDLREKMDEYLANGARLGWLLDLTTRTAYLYRPGVPVERLVNPATLAGDPVLPGFTLDLQQVWGRGVGR